MDWGLVRKDRPAQETSLLGVTFEHISQKHYCIHIGPVPVTVHLIPSLTLYHFPSNEYRQPHVPVPVTVHSVSPLAAHISPP